MPQREPVHLLLNKAVQRLSKAGIDSPRLSAELLLAKAMGTARLQLLVHSDAFPSDAALEQFAALLSRREQGEPAAYLLGCKEFFSRDFEVTPDTLIPRPETELLIEAVLNNANLPKDSPLLFADLGTGSGCIAVTIAAERPLWRGIAADISAGALAAAARNARRHNTADRLMFIQADFCRPFLADRALDLIVSNPPYISGEEYAVLSREVRDFEPAGALMPKGRPDCALSGLEDAARVIKAAQKALRPGGLLLIEHGFSQRGGMEILLKNNSWSNVQYFNDLSGKARFVQASRSASPA